jgi:hypothetical protein
MQYLTDVTVRAVVGQKIYMASGRKSSSAKTWRRTGAGRLQ